MITLLPFTGYLVKNYLSFSLARILWEGVTLSSKSKITASTSIDDNFLKNLSSSTGNIKIIWFRTLL